MSHSSTPGILFAATGERFQKEAVLAARSVRQAMPGIPIILFTDDSQLLDPDSRPAFDSVETLDQVTHNFQDKITALLNSPFDRTLFLDSDTFVVEDCSELFDLLDYFDFAAAQDPWRIDANADDSQHAFPEYNSGVLAIKKSEAMTQLLKDWLARHRQMRAAHPLVGDQLSLRAAIYKTSLRVHALPPEYNFRTFCVNVAGANARVKILHGRDIDFPSTAQLLNHDVDYRAFFPSLQSYLNPRAARIRSRAGRFVQEIAFRLVSAIYWLRGFRFESDWDHRREKILESTARGAGPKNETPPDQEV